MAGTGHRYEISNPTAASTFARELVHEAMRKGLTPAQDWLESKHFLKYLTDERFTYALKPAHVLQSNDLEERRSHILAKVIAGEEVRRFSQDLFESLGPDINHILDWAVELRAKGDILYRKLGRMETAVLIGKADEWTKRLASKSDGTIGTITPVMSITSDLTWFELKDETALQFEGSLMSHCVGAEDYAKSVLAGRCKILSLRKDGTKPILTLELNIERSRPSLVQVQKRGNGGLPVAYCNAVVDILNKLGVDAFRRSTASGYGLIYENGTWKSVYDTWDAIHIHGRQALTDGRQLLFMCASESGMPLVTVKHITNQSRWFVGAFDPLQVRIEMAGDLQPHYLDQQEVCQIARAFSPDAEHRPSLAVDWIGLDADKLPIPLVDTYERVETEHGVIYKGDARLIHPRGKYDYYLPHSQDPARIIMTASNEHGVFYAYVNEGQRISKAETERCLAFMTFTGAGWIKSDVGRGRAATEAFRREYQPVRSPATGVWRSFALDMVEVPAKKTNGRWQQADYHLRYRIPYSYIDFNIHDSRVVHCHGSHCSREHLLEIVSKLKSERLSCDKVLKIGGLASQADLVLLFMLAGKWVWIDCESKFKSVAKSVLQEADKDPSSVGENILDTLLCYAHSLSKPKDGKCSPAIIDIRDRLLVRWFLASSSFENYTVRSPLYSLWSNHQLYVLFDRLNDLADIGFSIEERKAGQQFRKCLKRISSALGRGKIGLIDGGDYEEFVIRWYRHLPKKYLNKINSYWLKCPTWQSKHNVAVEYRQIIENKSVWNTSFVEAVIRNAESVVTDADYSSMSIDDLVSHARLFDCLGSRAYLFEDRLKSLASLLQALNIHNHVDEDGLVGRLEDKLRQRQEYYANRYKTYDTKTITNVQWN